MATIEDAGAAKPTDIQVRIIAGRPFVSDFPFRLKSGAAWPSAPVLAFNGPSGTIQWPSTLSDGGKLATVKATKAEVDTLLGPNRQSGSVELNDVPTGRMWAHGRYFSLPSNWQGGAGPVALADGAVVIDDRLIITGTGDGSGTITSVAWTEVTGKPSSYPPSSHRHDSDDLTEVIAEPEIAFAVVDQDGRRTWVEVADDGGLTSHAADAVANAVVAPVAMEVGIEGTDTEVTGLAFAVVDEEGRRTDLEVGPDGHLTRRVIDLIGDRLAARASEAADPVTLVAPAGMPMMVGQTYRLHYADMLAGLAADHRVRATVGRNFGTHWEYTPTVASTTASVGFEVRDRTGAIVYTAAIGIPAYAAPVAPGKRHLAIGDSLTRLGDYVGAAASAAGMGTGGTRQYSGKTFATEGRGGWSLQNYMSRIADEVYPGDSPFLFPTTVAGAKFLGSTEFWKRVTTTDPDGYDYQGFQKIARGWADTGPYLFGTDGYPTAPVEGDVVVDSTFAEADEFRQYTSGAWVGIPRPAIEFSFAKYLDRYAAAYASPPTSISVMLMTNDFMWGSAGFATWKANLDTVIASVRAWSSTVPIVLLLAPGPGPQNYWATQAQDRFLFELALKDAARQIVAAYDTAPARANRVYVGSFLGAVSQTSMSDQIHPSAAGHLEMAPWLAGMLAKLSTEGII